MAPKHAKLQIFIPANYYCYNTFKMGIKTKNLPRTTRIGFWSFYKGLLLDDHWSKKTAFEWSQVWSSYADLTVFDILLNSRIGIPTYAGLLSAKFVLIL